MNRYKRYGFSAPPGFGDQITQIQRELNRRNKEGWESDPERVGMKPYQFTRTACLQRAVDHYLRYLGIEPVKLYPPLSESEKQELRASLDDPEVQDHNYGIVLDNVDKWVKDERARIKEQGK